jgi:predicted nuclease of predicted toxin-antitoxin system
MTEILAFATEEKRTLITHDQDFGELVFRKGMNSPHGIVAFRYEPDTPDEVAKRLLVMLRSGLYRFEGFLTAVDEGKVRQRACPIRP